MNKKIIVKNVKGCGDISNKAYMEKRETEKSIIIDLTWISSNSTIEPVSEDFCGYYTVNYNASYRDIRNDIADEVKHGSLVCMKDRI